MNATLDSTLDFCVRCFASSTDGSWGHVVSGSGCMNCGSAGCTVTLPQWAVESIRKNASWVGKRYYPAQEDRDRDRELRYLRSIANSPPFRMWNDDEKPNVYRVERDGTSVTFTAADHIEAVATAKTLLAVPVPAKFV